MKRYALFLFFPENPCGGWGDFIAAFETFDEAKVHFRLIEKGYAQIVDLKLMRVVKKKLRREFRSDLN